MSNMRPELPEVSIYSKVPLQAELFDSNRRNQMTFGTVEGICKQYGIRFEKMDSCIKFTAPKTRLQYLVEKLHFARAGYSRNPY